MSCSGSLKIRETVRMVILLPVGTRKTCIYGFFLFPVRDKKNPNYPSSFYIRLPLSITEGGSTYGKSEGITSSGGG